MTEDMESKYDTSWSNSSGKISHKEDFKLDDEHKPYMRKTFDYPRGGRLQQMLLDVNNRKEETTPWLCPQLKQELMFYWDNDPRYAQNLETKTQQSDQQSGVEGNGSNNYVHVDSKAVLQESPEKSSVPARTMQSGHLEAFPRDSSAPLTVAEIHGFMQDRLLRESEDRFRDFLAWLDKRELMIKEDRRAIEVSREDPRDDGYLEASDDDDADT
ncbi:hypothetical protein PIB30_021806 [Stylosanthes scabra]|uniref:Uncharacterized protein n=1 Tax=Stylosanthes scabra TaxID=79078 RepID=A0ABU6W921_9FABA|nr:hypothetical protein [Stylosanthes scabra]